MTKLNVTAVANARQRGGLKFYRIGGVSLPPYDRSTWAPIAATICRMSKKTRRRFLPPGGLPSYPFWAGSIEQSQAPSNWTLDGGPNQSNARNASIVVRQGTVQRGETLTACRAVSVTATATEKKIKKNRPRARGMGAAYAKGFGSDRFSTSPNKAGKIIWRGLGPPSSELFEVDQEVPGCLYGRRTRMRTGFSSAGRLKIFADIYQTARQRPGKRPAFEPEFPAASLHELSEIGCNFLLQAHQDHRSDGKFHVRPDIT